MVAYFMPVLLAMATIAAVVNNGTGTNTDTPIDQASDAVGTWANTGANVPTGAAADVAHKGYRPNLFPYRDKSWTSMGPQKNIGSQARPAEALTSHAQEKAEGMGFEPDADFAATGILPCGCVICPECRAALALQTGRPEWLETALNDADLRRVIAAWADLPDAIRRAMLALIEAIQ